MGTTTTNGRRGRRNGHQPQATGELLGVLYGRQSRTGDASESLPAQREAGRRTADTFGVTILSELVEPPSTSAYKNRGRSRPRFPELLEMVRSGAVSVVIAYKTDRLSRGGGPGWAPLLDAAEQAGLDLDRFILMPGGFMSEFEIGIRAAMDREESKKISERMLDMKERRAVSGRANGGGLRAYGYHRRDRARFDADGTPLPCTTCGSKAMDGVCEPEADVIRECAKRYLQGEGFRPIARSLNAAGRPTSTGNVWREATVRNMLSTGRIAGLREHNGEIVGDAAWPAIIDRETWERLRGRIEAKKGKPGPSPWKYLLPRLLVCGKCGGRMYGAPSHGRARYRCMKGPGRVNCGGLGIIAGPVEEIVTEMVLYRMESPVVADALAGRRTVETDADDTVERILELEGRLDELSVAYATGDMSMKMVSTSRRLIEEQLSLLRTRISRREQLTTISEFLVEAANLRASWADLPLGRRHALLQAVVDRIVVHPAKMRGSTNADPARIAERLEVVWRV